MYFTLFIALFSTFLWINTMFAEYIISKVNPYGDGEEKNDMMRGKLKIFLIIIMALFWAAFILYS